MRGLASDKAVFDTLVEGLSAKLDAYEVILGKQKYLAGNVSSSATFCIRSPHRFPRRSRLLICSTSRMEACWRGLEVTS